MKTTVLSFSSDDYRSSVLGLLTGSIFHLTRTSAFENIRRDGYISHNRDERFPLNVGSDRSFGRLNGWVCLFNLVNVSEEVVQDTITKYDFLRPSWFVDKAGDLTESHIAYLIIDPAHQHRIIPNETARTAQRNGQIVQYVPHTECWYPDNLPSTAIDHALLVSVTLPPPPPPLWVQHMLREMNENNNG